MSEGQFPRWVMGNLDDDLTWIPDLPWARVFLASIGILALSLVWVMA